jgi:hypothetical protein
MIPYNALVTGSSYTTCPCKRHAQQPYHPKLHSACMSRAHDMVGSFLPSTSTTLAAVPSAELAVLNAYSAQATTTTTTFDAVVPDTTTLIGFGIILLICAIAANVWANQVVPISRTKLAIAKQKNSNSTLRQYLDELLEIENNTPTTPVASTETTVSGSSAINDEMDRFVSDADTILDDRIGDRIDNKRSGGRFEGNRALERWLFTDWLVKDSKVRKSGRQKEPVIPILKSAKWNSGDNPVLVATTLIFLGVLLTSVTERITTIMSG